MEPQFKTSFIPKKPIAGPLPGSAVSRLAGINFLTLLATVVFLAAVLFGAGIFLYNNQLERQIENQVAMLREVQQTFEPNFIAQATRLNQRIVSAERLLERHVSPSAIFAELEASTLQTVSLNNFTFSDNVDGKIIIRASGEGDSFRSIVLQSDQFGKSGYMRDVLFSGLEPNPRGNVDFTFEAVLDPKLISFKSAVAPTVGTVSEEPPAVEQLEDEADLGVFGEQSAEPVIEP
ncbi:MAG: hypothetical protein RL150_455 [Candidatus Parcubacteria bacterium]|jgi:Tfp pilus assembly protein PilE